LRRVDSAKAKAWIRSGVQRLVKPDADVDTSRLQLLTLAEMSRRAGGDVPSAGSLDLAPFELRVFSQNGEDGVLGEIIRRTGAPGRWFVEFGTGAGIECNCALLADVFGWSGLFMEAGDEQYVGLERKYREHARIATRKTFVTPENVDDLLDEQDVPAEFDLLSVDVDGSDYWIWEALERHRPRIVVIEYNGALAAHRRLVQPRATGGWRETDFFGASLGALTLLGERKGYRHVHCDLTGNNAFFVRDDLPGDYLDPADVPRRTANFALAGIRHAPDASGRGYVDLDQAQTEP
jgi:hypothetical protein